MLRYVAKQAQFNPGLLNYYQEIQTYKRITPKRLKKYREIQKEIRRVRKPLGALSLKTQEQYDKAIQKLERKGKFVNREGNFATRFSPLSIQINTVDTGTQTKRQTEAVTDEGRLIINGFFERLLQFGWQDGATIIHDKIIELIENYGWNKTAEQIQKLERMGYTVSQALIYNDDGTAVVWSGKIMELIGVSIDEL